MKLRRSRLLSLVREGQLVTSFKANLNDPRVIEIAGLCGCDAVWICNEHVPNDWTNLEHQIRAARLHDVDTLVRVTKGSYSDYIRPFEADAHFDEQAFAALVPTAVRALDNVLEMSLWPLPQQAEEAAAKRRVGLGFTGLGDALVMLNLHYDSDAARDRARRCVRSHTSRLRSTRSSTTPPASTSPPPGPSR